MSHISRRLKELLEYRETLVMPDAYDPITAKIIENSGFEAVQCSGLSISAAQGYSAEAHLPYSENLEITRKIVNAVDVPVMADGEDGYGDLANIEQTISGFIDAGAAGINIEDQILDDSVSCASPSKNLVRVIGENEMVGKIKKAREITGSSANPDFVINARTDVLFAVTDREQAMEQAIHRANLYLSNGADLAFVVGIRNLDEVKELSDGINGPISIAAGMFYTMEEFSVSDLSNLGVARVSLPILPLTAAIKGVSSALKRILETGEFERLMREQVLCTEQEFSELVG